MSKVPTLSEVDTRIDQLSSVLHNATIAEITESIFTTEDSTEFTRLMRIGIEAHFSVLGSMAATMMARIQSGNGNRDKAMEMTAKIFVSELEAMLQDAVDILDDEADFGDDTSGSETSH